MDARARHSSEFTPHHQPRRKDGAFLMCPVSGSPPKEMDHDDRSNATARTLAATDHAVSRRRAGRAVLAQPHSTLCRQGDRRPRSRRHLR
ncbi:hypothetical protein BRAO375_4770072 [Bradyrhizobium sp. ORS 375]|nr:hypothetical protein BRAO375_4770072 [Bradyrhizobium sp. ORS 375]